jgi:hypothetical protein
MRGAVLSQARGTEVDWRALIVARRRYSIARHPRRAINVMNIGFDSQQGHFRQRIMALGHAEGRFCSEERLSESSAFRPDWSGFSRSIARRCERRSNRRQRAPASRGPFFFDPTAVSHEPERLTEKRPSEWLTRGFEGVSEI